MRLTRVALGTVALAFLTTVATAQANDDQKAMETVDAPAIAPAAGPAGPVRIWQPDGAVLYDNGSLVTHPNVCLGGGSASRLQNTSLLLNTFGFTASTATAFRLADNFTVPAGGWNVSQITFFGYQTGSTTTPTFNAARVQIWNGPPNAGGTVIFGDTTTNRFASAAWSTNYRDLETGMCTAAAGETRPIMAVTANINTTLPAGTYWVDFQLGGTLASGPFVPPTTTLGATSGCTPGPCNGLQFDGTTWIPLDDGSAGVQLQDVKFVVEGTGGQPTVNAGDVTVAEGNAGTTDALLPVTLTGPSLTPVTVNFATADGTATAGSDYTATSGTLTFAPGSTTQNVTVSITGDLAIEADETFFVNLTAPVGATPGDMQGLGTITNDDFPTLSVGDASVVEGDSGPVLLTAPVTLSAASTSPVTVAFATADDTATAGVDYTATSGVLTFAPGTTALAVTVSVTGDTLDENDETFFVNLSAPTNATIADGQGVETILDDDGADTTGELSHGFKLVADLSSSGGVEDTDTYQISQNPYSSYEVVVDEASGDITPVELERLDASSSVIQASLPVGTGTARSLRWANDTTNVVTSETVRVASGTCTTDCGAEDTYRIRAYETTYAIPRFNNTGTQVTVLILQNPTDYTIDANAHFWDAAGTRLHTEPITVGAKNVFVVVTSSIAAVNNQAGSVTVTHNGRYSDLSGKTVALEPATGFSFDSPMLVRVR